MPSTTLPAAATGLPASRRSILRGLVAAPFASVPALAAGEPGEPDPIFAAIEKHRAANKAFAEGDEDDAEEGLEVEQTALFDMHETVPQTVHGLAAYVAYVAEYTTADDLLTEEGWKAIPTIAKAMANLFPIKAEGGAL